MTAIWQWATGWIISLGQLVILISLGYHYLLALGGLLRRTRVEGKPGHARFAVVIPAHNEEAVIAQTIKSVSNQTLPDHLVDTYVVADHCTDRTADVARAAGAIVLERAQEPHGRKGYALKWGFDHVIAGGMRYDALAVFDADSWLDPGCLAAFTPLIAAGYPVLQGQKTIRNAEDTAFTALDDVNHRLADLLRGQAKTNLGLSARLMGDAMCFSRAVIQRYGWPTESLVEDREFGLYLLLQGIRVTYVPEARSSGEAARRWKDATTQRMRWVGGGQSIARAYAARFLTASIRHRRRELLDQFLELVLPPFTFSLALALVLFLLVIAFPGTQPLLDIGPSLGVLILWMLFPVIGLMIARAPARSYKALLLGPGYVAWRLFVAGKARFTADRIEWVRTKRSSELYNSDKSQE